MSSSLVKLRSVCKAHFVLIVALMLAEILLVVAQLLTHLASALAKLTLTDLKLALLSSATLRNSTGNVTVFVVIDLADVGKRRLFILLLIILIHILFKDLRKLLYFSALEDIICKGLGRSGDLVKSDLL